MGYLNPLLNLPAGRALLELPPEQRAPLEAVLRDLRDQANTEAEKSWAKRKLRRWPRTGEPYRPTPDTRHMP
jgi:hypothetical protein